MSFPIRVSPLPAAFWPAVVAWARRGHSSHHGGQSLHCARRGSRTTAASCGLTGAQDLKTSVVLKWSHHGGQQSPGSPWFSSGHTTAASSLPAAVVLKWPSHHGDQQSPDSPWFLSGEGGVPPRQPAVSRLAVVLKWRGGVQPLGPPWSFLAPRRPAAASRGLKTSRPRLGPPWSFLAPRRPVPALRPPWSFLAPRRPAAASRGLKTSLHLSVGSVVIHRTTAASCGLAGAQDLSSSIRWFGLPKTGKPDERLMSQLG